MKTITQFAPVVCGMCVAFIIAGCGSHADNANPTVEQNMAAGLRAVGQSEMNNSAKSSPAPQTDLPKGDPSVPDSAYIDLKSNDQIGELFYALSGLPPNYENLDRLASEEYRRTSDAFRKRDLGKALQPQIDQAIASFKDPSKRYFKVKLGPLELAHYDFTAKSFKVNLDFSPDEDHSFEGLYGVYGPGYAFNLTNGIDFRRFPVTDEAKAKEIEALITGGQLFRGWVVGYVYAQSCDTSNNRVHMQIMKIALLDHDEKEIGRY